LENEIEERKNETEEEIVPIEEGQ